MKKIIKVLSILILFLLILASFVNVYAEDPLNIGEFTNKTTTATADVAKPLNAALTIIQIIGMTVAVVMLVVLAIKYMVSSVSDRAEIKKHAVVYVTGAVLMFGASGIVEIIKAFSKNVK